MASSRMTVDEVLDQLFTESDSDGDFILESEEDEVIEEVLRNVEIKNI